jgi:hypothetical protein
VPEKVSRLAINMEGGFSTTATQEWDQANRIVVWPSMEAFELTDPLLPLQVTAWKPSSENSTASVGSSVVEPEPQEPKLFVLTEPEHEVIPGPTLYRMTKAKKKIDDNFVGNNAASNIIKARFVQNFFYLKTAK